MHPALHLWCTGNCPAQIIADMMPVLSSQRCMCSHGQHTASLSLAAAVVRVMGYERYQQYQYINSSEDIYVYTERRQLCRVGSVMGMVLPRPCRILEHMLGPCILVASIARGHHMLAHD